MRKLLFFLSIGAVALFSGCATNTKNERALAGPTAICQVCEYHHDLACLHVRVSDKTPRAQYQGQTYYFCSDSCRGEFLKKPTRYVKAHGN